MPTVRYEVPAQLRPDATVFYDNRRLMAVVVAFGAFILAAGLLMIVLGEWNRDILMTAVTILLLFFGPVFIAIGAWKLRGRPLLILDGEGMTVCRDQFGFIPWNSILSVRIGHFAISTFICVRVTNIQEVLDRRQAAGGIPYAIQDRPFSMYPDEIAILISLMNVRPERVLELVEQYRRGGQGGGAAVAAGNRL